jgi:thioredoxin-related protein
MKPRWAEIEKEHPWLKTEYFEYDEAEEAVKKYGITKQLPVFVFLDKNGDEFKRLTGELDKEEIVRIITEHQNR